MRHTSFKHHAFAVLAVSTVFVHCGPGGGTASLTADAADSADDLRNGGKFGLTAAQQPACAILVPENPLSAEGLATPYQLLKPCQEANADATSAFVQAVILDPATGALSVYSPLVIDQGSKPLVNPQPPALPKDAVVGIWFGFNGTTLVPVAQNQRTLVDAGCIFGLGAKSPFGQVFACNAPAFYRAAHAAIASGLMTPPALGTALDGKPCPTTRDFSIVDQDPSDNVNTSYLAAADGRIAQNTPENVAALKAKKIAVTVINNGSDNALLASHVDPALGCMPWDAVDITSPGGTVRTPSQGLNELHAQVWHNPNNVSTDQIALVEAGDEMVLQNGNTSVLKMDLYRLNVDQPSDILASTQDWCNHLASIGAPRINLGKPFTSKAASVDAAMGNSLFTFLVARLQATMADGGIGLNCAQYGVKFPFKVTTDGAGVVTSATYKP